MDTALKVKIGMLEEHSRRPGEYGYNETKIQFFPSHDEFYEAWAQNWDGNTPSLAPEINDLNIHKRFGTVYINEEGVPVACVDLSECSAEEMIKATKR